MKNDGGPAERFLAHLDRLSSGVEPQFLHVDSSKPEQSGITAIHYPDMPEAGTSIGFTYGLSRTKLPAWRYGRPELCICVDSNDPAWILAAALMAESLRGSCPFSYGDLLDFGQPIAPDSSMDAFVVFAPAVLDKADSHIDVGTDLPINLAGMYPTYSSERAFIQEHGLEAFWKSGWNPYDVTRPAAA